MSIKNLNRINKVVISIIFIILMGFVTQAYSLDIAEDAIPLDEKVQPINIVAEEEPGNKTSQTSDEAIVILSTVTLQEMHLARKLIENQGGMIINIFPPGVFIATIPRNIVDKLKFLDAIKTISYENVNPSDYQEYDYSVADAIKAWNIMVKKRTMSKDDGVSEELQEQQPFKDELLIHEDLPTTQEEKILQNQQYIEHWRLKKEELLRQEQEKKQQWQENRGEIYEPKSSLFMETGSNGSLGAFGRATGAGFNDTSLYMAGDIAVGVFFKDNWTATEINSIFADICNALNQFINDEPNANITFTYIKEVDASGNPKPLPEDERTYINDLRNTYQTHWAYMITVGKGNGLAYAWYFGPSLWIYMDDLRGGAAVRHETMHIFGAKDQYLGGAGPTNQYGYLKVVNANSWTNNGRGYFGGSGEGFPDIMVGDWGILEPIGVYSRGQIGWRDSDGDGILDPLDTFPDTVIIDKTGKYSLTYTGQATDKPLLNQYSNYYGNVTLNTITNVEYRINQGAWVAAKATFGAFDSGEEEFSFTPPPLSDGRYIIEIRATNSANNSELSYAQDVVFVTESRVKNVSPFASFSINPPEGSIESEFNLDASLSSDIEDVPSALQVRWDFENDGVWDTEFSYRKIAHFSYTTEGLKTIRLQVRDSGGLTNEVTKQVYVSESNQAPAAIFTTKPENQHTNENPLKVTFNAAASWDGEDDIDSLQARWDFEDDGIWDTDYSHNLVINHEYRLPLGFSATAIDTPASASGVYVSGNYVYVADTKWGSGGGSGLQIIDVTEPAKPRLAGRYNTPGQAYGVYTLGNYAYVADGNTGLQIIDVTNTDTPTLVGSYRTSDGAEGVYVSGNYAYVAAKGSGLQIIDVTNPAKPTLAGSCYYDTTPIARFAYAVYVSGNYAYVADAYSGLKIIDVIDPAKPRLSGSYKTPSGARDVHVSGNYAYVAGRSSGLYIIDAANPSIPKLVGNYNTPGHSFGVHVSGNYAYVADGNSGCLIFDVKNPFTPTWVGLHNTPDLAKDIYVSGNYAYVADGDSGLQIIDITNLLNLTGPSAAMSKHWRVRLEVMDKNFNTAQTTRDIWAVTYNQPPLLEDLQASFEEEYRIGSYDTPNNAYGVYVQGNYAYVAIDWPTGMLQIINITDPSNPTLAGSYNTTAWPRDVFISGSYAYLAARNAGLQIVDVTNPSLPTLISSYDTPGDTRDIYVQGNHAYVADSSSGLQIIDITEPSNPTLLGSYDTSGSSFGVYVQGNYAYMADGPSGLQIIDITDSTNPTLVGVYKTPSYAFGVYVQGNYAYMATSFSGLQIIDIADPTQPKLAGSYNTSGEAERVYVQGNYAFVADKYPGLQVIDVTDPRNPTLLRTHDTPKSAHDIYVQGNYAYVADDEAGLQILSTTSYEKLVFTCIANDPNKDTRWDGLLEYRWDLDNDSVWDTEFIANNKIELPVLKYSLLACEVMDRFGAREKKISQIPIPNLPPVLNDIGNKTVDEGKDLTFIISAIDPERNLLSYSTTDLPSGAIFEPATQTFSWIPDFDQAGSYSVTFTVSDGKLTDSETMTITVNNVNRAPVLNPISNKLAYAKSFLNFRVSAFDPDGDALTYTVNGLPQGATFNATTQTFSWLPKSSDRGIYYITFRVTDTSGASDSESVQIEVEKKEKKEKDKGKKYKEDKGKKHKEK